MLAALSSGDGEAYASHFSEDAVLQPPNAPSIRGRAALEEFARSIAPDQSLTWPNYQLHGSGDLAYSMSDYVIGDPASPADRGKQLAVLRRKDGGGWEVVAVSFSSDLAAPGTP